MQWSPQQDRALGAVAKWLQARDKPYFYLGGYAGTGKTTLARHLAQGVDGTVLYGAYTGKAAHVLRSKGCYGASTLHSLIYQPKDKSRARLRELEQRLVGLTSELRAENAADYDVDSHPEVQELTTATAEERDNLSQPAFALNPESSVLDADLLVVDECSMVGGRMGEDLLSFGTPILVLGDPAQLPPVGEGAFFTGAEPDFMLTEIHRQARDNPIIAMATDVREGRPLQPGTYGDSAVVHRTLMKPEDPVAADQILVGRNKTRRACNRRIRELRGLGPDWTPVPGDKLVCLRNDHDLGLLNGSLWSVNDVGGVDDDKVIMTLETLDGVGEGQVGVEAWAHHFRGDSQDDMPAWWDRKNASEFDFGYALTVHKAQGSQWDHVLLFDESRVFRNDADRWLYTGITRAAESVVVVRGL